MAQQWMKRLSPRALRARLDASATAVVRQSPWDRRAAPVLVLWLMLLSFETAYIAATDLSFQTSLGLQIFGFLLWLLGTGFLARHYGMTRVGDTLQGLALPSVFGSSVVVLTVILTRHSLPFADARIVAMDKALGLDWPALLTVYRDNDLLTKVSRFAYRSMLAQLPVLCVLLFLTGKTARAWTFINAWALALFVVALIHPFFTALGPYLHYGISPYDFPGQKMVYPWTTGPTLDAIRTHRNTDVIGSMGGLVFFPSFHSAAGVMFIYASWAFRRLRWLFVPLNLLMISACPIIGYHYFSDVLAGLTVGVCSVFAARWVVRRIGEPSAAPRPG